MCVGVEKGVIVQCVQQVQGMRQSWRPWLLLAAVILPRHTVAWTWHVTGVPLRRHRLQAALFSHKGLRLGNAELQIDCKHPIGSGSYGIVYPGLLGQQEVIVKTSIDPDDEAIEELGLRYLEVEDHCNKKLAKILQSDPVNANFFAPFLGRAVDPSSAKRYLVWKKTGSGRTLRQVLHDGDLVQTLVGLGIGTDRSSALHALLGILGNMVKVAHTAGLVHRDLKPANILIDEDGRTLRLIDFGSAADMKALFRRTGYDYMRSPCSPFYCAPEQFIDESCPWAFDVYSVGVVWLRCVFPQLHDEAAWEEWYQEFQAADHDLDLWLQRELSDDAMPGGMLEGLAFFTGDGGRGWRLLKQMLCTRPKERLSLDLLLSDPYVVGAGGIVSRRNENSRTFFDTIVSESVDICAVDEQPISVRVSLSRPMGLGLEEGGDDAGHEGPAHVTSLTPGGAADRCGLVAVGDVLLMVGDVDCTGRPFDDIMDLIKTFPGQKVPLAFERGAAHPRPQPDTPTRFAAMHVSDCGAVSVRGKRGSMEDAFCLSTLTVTPFGEEHISPTRTYLAAVFDGHRGSTASQFAATKLPQMLRRTMARRHRMGDAAALRRAWKALEQEYLHTGKQSGSTVAAALVVNGVLHILNCGDSRVVLTALGHVEDASSATGSAAAAAVAFATRDHSASNGAEKMRIESSGGQVFAKCKPVVVATHLVVCNINLRCKFKQLEDVVICMRRAARRAVFFGVAAPCRAVARRHPPIPTKAVVSQLACRAVIIIVPEVSPPSAARGVARAFSQAATSTATGIVWSSTLPHRVCPIQATTHDGNQGLMVFNRECSGATNMGMRGVCTVCGVEDIIPGYPWMGPEGDGNE
ncbi:kinase-like domain-containing protein [Tribonema minus]|uniref:Kinase-like domain-containing protein n=1 Tax=Tribonema minus TaxID=303371 RepID=A0A835YR05_9STRA|nr:kinase-like domain-containing protein [Tribonema minus]